LADPRGDSENIPIEILIGGDHYWEIVKDTSPIRLSPSVVLLLSKLGWILSGNRSAVTASSIMVNYVNLDQISCPSDDAVRRFWDLETLGITDKQKKSMSARDTALLRDFHASYSLQDQRRVVSLPRKENINLPSHHHNVKRLLRRLEQILEGNVALRHVYHNHMLDYIRKEKVEIATPGEEIADEIYLPHHAVKKEKRGVAKWRIVLGGSSREDHAPSVNDALLEFTSGDFSDSAAIPTASRGNHRRYWAGILTIDPPRKGQRPDEVLLVSHYQRRGRELRHYQRDYNVPFITVAIWAHM